MRYSVHNTYFNLYSIYAYVIDRAVTAVSLR